MELIDELEVTRRGPYSGGFGGVSFTGNMDIALALRTIVFPTGSRFNTMYSYKDMGRRQEWVAHLQAGAGIVADSNPDDEQRECENKAAALARAIDLAESTFVDKSLSLSTCTPPGYLPCDCSHRVAPHVGSAGFEDYAYAYRTAPSSPLFFVLPDFSPDSV
ncbi:hypothetical protein B296_00031343 [Ensete ventricosum]|uniref:Chorismate-utilising enzyme C-terminal domain-containing protein n=1 Tax=Ensete ventricosum TaxID=4639 RepID=A0A426ZL56_ENSVE|nr:hypothetical protein B296_00031343 [Ensete ventricosum]